MGPGAAVGRYGGCGSRRGALTWPVVQFTPLGRPCALNQRRPLRVQPGFLRQAVEGLLCPLLLLYYPSSQCAGGIAEEQGCASVISAGPHQRHPGSPRLHLGGRWLERHQPWKSLYSAYSDGSRQVEDCHVRARHDSHKLRTLRSRRPVEVGPRRDIFVGGTRRKTSGSRDGEHPRKPCFFLTRILNDCCCFC